MSGKLHSRVSLVTGSSSGVGAAIAQGFAAEGADVVVNYSRNRDGAQRTAEAVRAAGRKVLVVQADVGKAAAVADMFGVIGREFGRLDILANNAGITPKKPFCSTKENDWDEVINTNLKSVFLCSKAALPLMPRGSAILNISSVHARITTFNFSAYGASKAGMEALTRSMAIELGIRQIRVNALRLGWIRVERDHLEPSDPRYGLVSERIPLLRLGEVGDVVPTAVHLCSDDASYITGQVIAIDGGHGTMLHTAFPKGHVADGAFDEQEKRHP